MQAEPGASAVNHRGEVAVFLESARERPETWLLADGKLRIAAAAGDVACLSLGQHTVRTLRAKPDPVVFGVEVGPAGEVLRHTLLRRAAP